MPNCLLIAPKRYPFVHAIKEGLEANEMDVTWVDYPDFVSARSLRFFRKYRSFPRKIRDRWEIPFERKVLEGYHRTFQNINPELIFVYNDQMLTPDLLATFKKSSKLAFMLGDNPLYSGSRNKHNLEVLFQADSIISPSTEWMEQLDRLGIRNIYFDSFGFTETFFKPIQPTSEEQKQHTCDLAYIGTSKKNNWGLQRILFLNAFHSLDLRAYLTGDLGHWKKRFPTLKEKIYEHNRFDPAFNNLVYNCAKIAPIEQVPSLLNGVHVRVFDVLGAGILPLCEYSRDLLKIFDGIDIPLIHNYLEGSEIAKFWLDNDERRSECIHNMRTRVIEKYRPEMVIKRLLNNLGL